MSIKKSYITSVKYILTCLSLIGSSEVFSTDFELKNDEWRIISLPSTPPENANTVATIFGDDISGEYTLNWAIFSFNLNENKYDMLDYNDILEQGKGYWIIQNTGQNVILDMPKGSKNTPNDFIIKLTPSQSSGMDQWNLAGNPFSTQIKTSEFSIKTESGICFNQACSLDEANEEKIFHNTFWRFNGAEYEEINTNESLHLWEGFWSVALEQSYNQNALFLSHISPPSPTGIFPPQSQFTEISTDYSISKPAYLETIIDPVFGTAVTRITDRDNQEDNALLYPKNQAWNSDMSLIRFKRRLYDANTFEEKVVTQNQIIDGTLSEMKWSNKSPNTFYGINRNRDGDVFKFIKATIEENQIDYQTLGSFPKSIYNKFLLGPWEGNIDFNDKFVVFSANKVGHNNLTAIVYDIENNIIVTVKDFPEIRWEDENQGQILDWISVSPLGDYVLINWKDDPQNPNENEGRSVHQYDINLNYIRKLSNQGEHGDIGLDANNQEVYVQFEFGGDDRGIWSYRLTDGKRTRLLPNKYGGGHVSCRNILRPGWCYISTTQEKYREVFALKLDGSGIVNRFAQTRTSGHNSHGNVSPDGTRMLFDSDWNSSGDTWDTYHVTVNIP